MNPKLWSKLSLAFAIMVFVCTACSTALLSTRSDSPSPYSDVETSHRLGSPSPVRAPPPPPAPAAAPRPPAAPAAVVLLPEAPLLSTSGSASSHRRRIGATTTSLSKIIARSPAAEDIAPTATQETASNSTQTNSSQDAAPAILQKEIDAWIDGLPKGAYAFNTPASFGAMKSTMVYFKIDPKATQQAAAAALQQSVPQDKVSTGEIPFSPSMRATLSGDDFEIQPVDSMEQIVTSTIPTTWRWEVTPKHPGSMLPLNLKVEIVLPAGTRSVSVLSKEIYVTVTLKWLLSYVDWKWLTAAVGGLLAKLLHSWWKKKTGGASAGAPVARKRNASKSKAKVEEPAVLEQG